MIRRQMFSKMIAPLAFVIPLLLLTKSAEAGGDATSVIGPGRSLLQQGGCPSYVGFTVTANMDHDQDDIDLEDSANAAAGSCYFNPKCAGFNDEGWTKYNVTPTGPLSGECLYKKAANPGVVDCTAVPGSANYQLSPTFVADAVNNLRNYTDLATAIADCDVNQFCFGVGSSNYNTLFTTKGSPATNILLPTSVRSDACLYTKRTTVCARYKGYSGIPDVDSTGPAMNAAGTFINMTDALAACDASASCMGVSGDLLIQRSTLSFSYSRGMCFYMKIPTICTPPPDGYSATPDLIYTDTTLLNKSSQPGLSAAHCNQMVDCVGYTGVGLLKSTMNNPAYARGICWYQKKNDTNCPPAVGYDVVPDYDRADKVSIVFGNANVAGLLVSGQIDCWNKTSCSCFSTNTDNAKQLLNVVVRLGNVTGFNGQPFYKYRYCLYNKQKWPTVCPTVTGYTAVPDRNLTATSVIDSQGLTSCNSKVACVAYTANTSVTVSNPTLSIWPRFCTYTKNNDTTCPDSYLWFKPLKDTDMAGGPYNLASAANGAAAATDCKAASNCEGFNNVDFYMRTNATANKYQYSYGRCFYQRRKNAVCRDYTGYTTYPDKLILQAKTYRYNYSNPYDSCNTDAACTVFSNDTIGTQWFGSDTPGDSVLVETPGCCSWVKGNYLDPNCNYTARLFTRTTNKVLAYTDAVGGQNLLQATNFTTMQSANLGCYGNNNCFAFDYRGYIFKRPITEVYQYMACYYASIDITSASVNRKPVGRWWFT